MREGRNMREKEKNCYQCYSAEKAKTQDANMCWLLSLSLIVPNSDRNRILNKIKLANNDNKTKTKR